MDKVLNLTYASSLTDLCEVNSSFDRGILRIAYTGKNRNGSYIDKDAFEKSMNTIYNCPIVCNYDRESDTLGGHDMEVIRDGMGSLRLVNLTTPVGCIPESSEIFWQTIEEEDGTSHEYLCVEALLWKRQEAYQKIKRDGITSQSMEINIKDGKRIDGVYHIYDFEYTAFALIGVEPCYESAALEFSKQDFKQQFEQMMLEIKESFSLVNSPVGARDDIHPLKCSTEGGKETLTDMVNTEVTAPEESEKFQNDTQDAQVEEISETNNDSENTETQNFAIESNIKAEIIRGLESETIQCEWGEMARYWFVDYDKEAQIVYCWDTTDWLLYGFEYEANGDTITVKFDCKKRKKFEIVDFDEGEQASPLAQIFTLISDKFKANSEYEAKYQAVSDDIKALTAELDTLRKFKEEYDLTTAQNARNEVFAQFEDLTGVEAFEELRNNCMEYEIEALEEKCFAIRGKNTSAKFSCEYKPQSPKLMVEKTENISEPYGGIFQKYGMDK